MPDIENKKSNLFGNVVRLGWVSALTDVSSEMLYAVTPLFLTTVLGASASILGLIEGIAEGTASVLKGVSGWHSDRIRKRRIFVFGGYSLSAIAKPLIAVAAGWPLVLIARFLDRFGKGVRTTARDALIADSCPPEKRGRAFGLHRAMDTAGALVGVGISLVLLLWLKSSQPEANAMRMLYWIAFLPAVIGVLLILWVREIKPKPADITRPKRTIDLRFGKHYYVVLILFSLFTLGCSSDAFLILRARHAGWSAELVIGAYLLYNASYSFLSYPFGRLSDRLPKERLLGLGMLVYAGVYFGFGWLPTAWAIWPLFLVYGVYIALTEGVSKALISNLVPSEVRGTALGLFYMVTGILSVAASILAGVLWDQVSPAAPFYFGALMALAAAVGFFFLRKPLQQSAESVGLR
ncbi:MFS transporter [bacterium]|nr:MFS transporter [bacterium]MBU1984640.1 MFS transporter [bacterium]